MNSSEADEAPSRRSFLKSGCGWFTGFWIASHWPAIVAAHHLDEAQADAPKTFEFFSAGEAADMDALAAQIVPSGGTPGAREARAVYFMDRSLKTYLVGLGGEFREGLSEFQREFRAAYPHSASFAAAGSDAQTAFLHTVDRSAFFETARMLTILGMFTSPKYGGNFQGAGWKLLGFVDQHAFAPPFGYYDRDYPGFTP